MGSMKADDVAPGWIDVWRLWRHCLCRFGWYPLFMAPLVTCACLLDLYSSTGCDFIRMNIGFIPANDVWGDSYAQLGLFSFDSHQTDRNKWKRSFNNGCQLYSTNFETYFLSTDQTWHVSRIMAYISGISSLVALSTAWLLTITPLPASFFWPGVLLPAVVLAMLTGAGKFILFDAQICSEPLWFVDETSEPVAAQSCEIGESSVFGIASVAAYFFCTILICFRSPQKRVLDENFGRRPPYEPGSTVTGHTGTDIIVADPEQGAARETMQANTNVQAISGGNLGTNRKECGTLNDSQGTMRVKNNTPQVIDHGPQHTRTTSDVTWSTGSNKNVPVFNERSRNLGVLPPPPQAPAKEEKRPELADMEWNMHGRPTVVTINENANASRSLSYSDGSTQSSSKSPGPSNRLPPRHKGKSAVQHLTHKSNPNSGRSESDVGSISSRISKISFSDTHASDDFSALGMQSYSASSSVKGAPSVVAIPRRSRNTFSGGSPGSSHSSSKKLRYAKRSAREDRNDIFLNEQHSSGNGGSRFDAKRELVEYLPRLDEMSATRSLEDHGDLINKCVADLQRSFHDNGLHTM